MRHKKRVLWICEILFIGLFSFVSSPPTAHAQAEPTIIYQTHFEDDPAGGGDAYYGNETYYDGEFWSATCGVDASGCVDATYNYFTGFDQGVHAYLEYNILSPDDLDDTGNPAWEACAINHVEFDLKYVSEGDGEDDSVFSIALSNGYGASISTPVTPDLWDFRQDFNYADLPGVTQGDYFHVALDIDNTDPMDSFALQWDTRLIDLVGGGTYDEQTFVDNLVVWCDFQSQWIRPLAAVDEHPQWEMFDRQFAESLGAEFDSSNTWVNAFSANFHTPVHSAVAGTVVYVNHLKAVDPICGYGAHLDEISDGVLDNICVVYLPEQITQDGNQGYKLDLVEAYKVIVAVGDLYLTYLVYNAPAYVSVDDEIGEGCIIGETIQLLNQTNVEVTSINAGIGIGFSVDGGPGEHHVVVGSGNRDERSRNNCDGE